MDMKLLSDFALILQDLFFTAGFIVSGPLLVLILKLIKNIDE
jgi:hypothetical protein